MGKLDLEKSFKASMLSLDAGDVIICQRGGLRLYSIVLERIEKKSEGLKFVLSSFSTSPTLQPHDTELSWDSKFDYFCETTGRIFLLPEQWVSTEKDAAQSMLAKSPFNKPGYMEERAKAIFQIMISKEKNYQDSAREILTILMTEPPSEDSVALFAYALNCAARRVWSL